MMFSENQVIYYLNDNIDVIFICLNTECLRDASLNILGFRPEFFIYLFNRSSLSNFPKSEIKIKLQYKILFYVFLHI